METMTSILIIGNQSAVINGSYQALIEAESSISHQIIDKYLLDRLVEGAAELSTDSYHKIALLIPSTPSPALSSNLLSLLIPALKSNGTLEIRGLAVDNVPSVSSELTLAGLSNISNQLNMITATKIEYTAAPLSLKRSSADSASTDSSLTSTAKALPMRTSRAAKASLWAFTAPSSGTTTPTIDESTLLTAADLERPTLIRREDCDVKKTRKACKNCSCGLAELLLDEEEQDDLVAAGFEEVKPTTTKKPGTKRMKSTVTSSCGNCYLGDAFRCGGCPYLGMPAFEPGQKITIGDDMDDI